jgi:benzoyl-CoA reductase/2-hydroxyglutaryl-CoA dehydratase subunit BcrC/BadD/HgdB
MAFLEVEEIQNENRTYQIGLEEIGFIKGKIIKKGNELEGVPLTFTPKCELIIYSSTRNLNLWFVSIYYESHNYGLTQYGVICNILKEKGCDGVIDYIKKINPKNLIGDNRIRTSTNKELARVVLELI